MSREINKSEPIRVSDIDRKIFKMKHPDIDPKRDYALKHYSTSIDAWELWEELPEPKMIQTHDGGYYIFVNKSPLYVVRMWGETFPLAVCKAWIALKEKV